MFQTIYSYLNFINCSCTIILIQVGFFCQGFQLTFEEVSMACGGSLTLTNDIKDVMIASPNYPSPPPPHAECEWIVTAPTGHAIQLDFTANVDNPR